MSKKLLRILAICIFATLIPVAIVAIAMAATMSAPFTISVEVKTQSNKDASQNVSISVNDRERNGLAVGVKADDKVTITFGDETSYDSNGFYEGNASAVTNESDPVAEGYSYSFVVEGDATITLWVELKKYNVEYRDEEGNEIETAETLYHGDALKTINDQAFAGWVVMEAPEGYDITKNVVDTASFGISGDYVLTRVDKSSMVIQYFSDGDATEPIKKDTVYKGQNYTLASFEDEDISQAIESIGPGYEVVGWMDIDGNIVTDFQFNSNTTLDLFLKKQAVEYVANATFSKSSNSTISLTFDVENGFSEFSKRPNYQLSGFEYNGLVYAVEGSDFVNNGAKLTEVLVEVAENERNITAIWQAAVEGGEKYNNVITNHVFSFYILAEEKDGGTLLVDGNEIQKEVEFYQVAFDGVNERKDLNQTIYSALTGSDDARVEIEGHGDAVVDSLMYGQDETSMTEYFATKEEYKTLTYLDIIKYLVDGKDGYEENKTIIILITFD